MLANILVIIILWWSRFIINVAQILIHDSGLLFPPYAFLLQLLTKQLHYYEPGKTVPSIKIKAIFRHQSSASNSVPELFHKLTLKGIREPNIITIDIDPSLPIDSQCTIQAGACTCSVSIFTRVCILCSCMHTAYRHLYMYNITTYTCRCFCWTSRNNV